MRVDPKYVRMAAVAVLTITGLVVVSTVLAALASTMFLVAVQYFGALLGHPPMEFPLGFYQGVLIVSVILLPATFLIRFYFKAVFRSPSLSYLAAGWSASVIYYAGLIFVLVRYLPGASLGVYGLSLPFWSFAVLALLLSAFLAAFAQWSDCENRPPPLTRSGQGS